MKKWLAAALCTAAAMSASSALAANINFVTAGTFRPFAIRDGNLITGQQQFSGRAAADLVIEALGR